MDASLLRRFALLLLVLGLSAPSIHGAEQGLAWDPSNASPGVGLVLKELKRQKISGHMVVFYQVAASGLASGMSYTIYHYPTLSQAAPVYRGFTLDAAGKVVCLPPPAEETKDPKGGAWCEVPLDEVQLVAAAHLRGTAFRVGLISEDRSVRAFGEVFPFPIEATAGRCHLRAELVSPGGDGWAIMGEGFEPGETVQWRLSSKKKSIENKAVLNSAGKLAIIIRPPKEGKLEGKVTVVVEGASCSPSLQFSWGKDALKEP